ncbi:uncharacterized protein LOC119394138 [Rhipicephalus sanguineus]|uniref:Uncharacterized protein n=1 Tax=Rhipicephalus sanguineus TaxID=34632 RepID=A0A9D4PRS2_RHISA|nr:uncharacterized protein LOC119394138 [Rhipicephalus sanguineus]KAH7951211.1 hypothetical protein HPB52_006312 [Rhipicephalus sanguineus]
MRIRLSPYDDVAVLEQQVNAVDQPENVHELELTNCVVADPDDLCRCVIRCTELRILYCVSCGIRLKCLIFTVLPKLPHLSHLELTLDESVDREETLTILGMLRATKTISGSIRHLYVEVSGSLRIRVLSAMLQKLPNVTELHVHILREVMSEAIRGVESLWRQTHSVQCFKMTSETPVEAQREPAADRPLEELDFGNWASVCGNLLVRRNPRTRNCFRVSDLAVLAEPLHPTEPVIVVISNDEGVPTQVQIREAGLRSRWCDVRSLTLVLVRSGDASQEVARANADIEGGLVTFFGRFKGDAGGIGHLKELNLSSFHFEDEVDFMHVLSEAGLTTLTALSVTPCGIWHPGALGRLSTTCTELDDLDVRVYTTYRTCSRCWQPLELSDVAGSHLNRGRLTFSNVPDFASLDFLSTSHISELRMSGKCKGDAMAHVRAVIQKVRPNALLRCLVLNFEDLDFDQDTFKDLPMLLGLRFLCLQTPNVHSVVAVEGFIEWVASHSYSLEVLHVHFTHNITGLTERYTWVRNAETAEELQSGNDANPPGPMPGTVFTDRPCVICSTQTFVGLIKPHNRGSRTQV